MKGGSLKSETLLIGPIALALLVVSLHGQQPQPPVRPDDGAQARFKSGVELINVTATVSDLNGRFVPGLQQDDFLVYEDDKPMTVTQFKEFVQNESAKYLRVIKQTGVTSQ